MVILEKDDYIHKFSMVVHPTNIKIECILLYIMVQTKRIGMQMHISWFMDDIYEP